MGGLPCIRDLRFPVATVVATVADGMTFAEILAEHPDLEGEDIREASRYAAEAVRAGASAANGRVRFLLDENLSPRAALDRLDADGVQAPLRDDNEHGFVIIADYVSMTAPEHALVVIDLRDETGRTSAPYPQPYRRLTTTSRYRPCSSPSSPRMSVTTESLGSSHRHRDASELEDSPPGAQAGPSTSSTSTVRPGSAPTASVSPRPARRSWR
jgi:uncharacterized protein (DUF433 family)